MKSQNLFNPSYPAGFRENYTQLFRVYAITGMWIVGAPPKKLEKSSALRVALIRISLKSRRRGRRSFSTINKKSMYNWQVEQ